MPKQNKYLSDYARENTSAAAREQLILEHLPQIKYVAQRIHCRVPKGVELDDLISAGILGLLDAVEKFEPEKGVKFRTYAEVRIRGAILDSLRALDWAPRKLRQKSREVENVIRRLSQEKQRPATDQEIAEEMKISLSEFYELLNELRCLSIGSFTENSSDRESEKEEKEIWYYPFASIQSPFQAFQQEELQRRLAEAIRQLPSREQTVISLYYQEELTMKEIGEVIGITESRVCQIHSRAVLRLRASLPDIPLSE